LLRVFVAAKLTESLLLDSLNLTDAFNIVTDMHGFVFFFKNSIHNQAKLEAGFLPVNRWNTTPENNKQCNNFAFKVTNYYCNEQQQLNAL